MKESADLKVLFFKNAGMTQKDAAAAWGLGNQSNLAHYLNGRQTLSLEVAIKFAKGLGVSIEDFSPRLARQARLLLRSVDVPQMGDAAQVMESRSDDAEGHLVPILSNGASMGNGEDQHDEDAVSGFRILPAWVSSNLRHSRIDALRFIHGHGDSMWPTYASGDILLVDTDVTNIKVDGVYVLWAHGRLFIKRVRQRMDGQFEISSDNPAHKTVDTLSGTEQVTIKGRVVWAWNGKKV